MGDSIQVSGLGYWMNGDAVYRRRPRSKCVSVCVFMCASLGTFTTCTHERLSLYSSTESDWAPLTKSYLLASLCVLACPLAQELLKWERGSR